MITNNKNTTDPKQTHDSTVKLSAEERTVCKRINDQTKCSQQTDPVAAAMIPYLEQHIKEEMHHDEWLLEDLEVLGLSRDELLRRMPSATVASLNGAQYYWIFHHHPVAKLGHIAVMEGYPASVEAIEMMVDVSGLPRQAFRTLEKHCHLDPHHRDDLNAALDALPLEDKHHEMLGVSALNTIQVASRAYREVLDRFEDEA